MTSLSSNVYTQRPSMEKISTTGISSGHFENITVVSYHKSGSLKGSCVGTWDVQGAVKFCDQHNAFSPQNFTHLIRSDGSVLSLQEAKRMLKLKTL
jgi:hypothetical protein